MANAKIAQELGPYVFAWAEEDGVGMLTCLVRQRGDMQPAECDECSLTAIVIGDSVRAKRRRDVDLDDDEVGRIVEVEFFDMLVDESDVIVRIEIRSEGGQPERREERVFNWTKQRAGCFSKGGKDEFHFHGGREYMKYFML